MKAIALFQDEVDARLACILDNQRLDILGRGKLTVQQTQSAKIKVSTAIFLASKRRIDKAAAAWKERQLVVTDYSDTLKRFVTLKIQGDQAKDVVDARKRLLEITNGKVITTDNQKIWCSGFNRNGDAYNKLKKIEEALDVLVIRDKSKRQLRYYGLNKRYEKVARRVAKISQRTILGWL